MNLTGSVDVAQSDIGVVFWAPDHLVGDAIVFYVVVDIDGSPGGVGYADKGPHQVPRLYSQW